MRCSSGLTRVLISCVVAIATVSCLGSPDPVLAAPATVYFPQTGHTLSDQFLTYWRDHGGLEIFGYPISEPLEQGGMKVQYFERTRFELHPVNAGTPYEVEVSLLGTEITEPRAQDPAFKRQPVLPDWQNSADRSYFAATGHYLSYGFKKYWEEHGGLSVFGYPISEELTENGRTVQYFQRARFEWWPENQGTPYEVQLGLLGDWAASRDHIDTSGIGQPNGVPDYSVQLFAVPESLHIPVLLYHYIGPNQARYVTPLSKFELEMDWVQAHGYQTVTLQQVYDYMFKGGALPTKPIMITFDDSTAGQWDAATALDARGMKAVFFVVTGHDQFTPDQLRSLVARGDEIESHTVSHPFLTKESDANLTYELTQSRATLESIIGKPVRFIAYPYGDVNTRVIDAVTAAGYSAGIGAWGGEDWTPAKRWSEPRVEISGLLSIAQFAALVQQ